MSLIMIPQNIFNNYYNGLVLGAGTGKLLSHLGFPIILIILIAGLLGGLLGKTMFIYLDKKLK